MTGKESRVTFIAGCSIIGGGYELIALNFISFIWGRRSKFFYYLFVFLLNQSILGLFKLTYHKPRPFWREPPSVLKTFDLCPTQFGTPSSHPAAAVVFTMVLILDYYHGRTLTYSKLSYKGMLSYIISFVLALFWIFI